MDNGLLCGPERIPGPPMRLLGIFGKLYRFVHDGTLRARERDRQRKLLEGDREKERERRRGREREGTDESKRRSATRSAEAEIFR